MKEKKEEKKNEGRKREASFDSIQTGIGNRDLEVELDGEVEASRSRESDIYGTDRL